MKKERKLELFDGERLVKTYPVALGFAPEGDKDSEGDGKTPEGEFYVCVKNSKSKFHLSLGISYPDMKASERGLRCGAISQNEYESIIQAIAEQRMPLQKTSLGGEIYIHGGGTASDWTDGCIALADEDIAELFDLIPLGVPFTIKP